MLSEDDGAHLVGLQIYQSWNCLQMAAAVDISCSWCYSTSVLHATLVNLVNSIRRQEIRFRGAADMSECEQKAHHLTRAVRHTPSAVCQQSFARLLV